MSSSAIYPDGDCSGHVGYTLRFMCKRMRKKANLPLETTVNELMKIATAYQWSDRTGVERNYIELKISRGTMHCSNYHDAVFFCHNAFRETDVGKDVDLDVTVEEFEEFLMSSDWMSRLNKSGYYKDYKRL